MVEAQHIASTMKIVDTREEQDLLESLLESSKPAQDALTQGLDYLLATPFRYAPLPGGSRFRGMTDPGVFYCAESVSTAAAELGYWRWRFLNDAVDLDRLQPVAHTAFRADIATDTVNLRLPPFIANQPVWEHPGDYRATQAFARVVREAGVGAILYRSVRDPEHGGCTALLTPAGFTSRKPHEQKQTWFLAVSRQSVTWRRDSEALQFSAAAW